MRPVAAALAVGVCLITGCGGDEPSGARLAWAEPPRIERPPSLPRDRILTARVENRSSRAVELRASEIAVRDARGRSLRSSAAFVAGFVYSPVPYNRGRGSVPSALPRAEQARLGRLVRIEPGATAPLTVSWRTPAGRRALRLSYRGGSLRIPPTPG